MGIGASAGRGTEESNDLVWCLYKAQHPNDAPHLRAPNTIIAIFRSMSVGDLDRVRLVSSYWKRICDSYIRCFIPKLIIETEGQKVTELSTWQLAKRSLVHPMGNQLYSYWKNGGCISAQGIPQIYMPHKMEGGYLETRDGLLIIRFVPSSKLAIPFSEVLAFGLNGRQAWHRRLAGIGGEIKLLDDDILFVNGTYLNPETGQAFPLQVSADLQQQPLSSFAITNTISVICTHKEFFVLEKKIDQLLLLSRSKDDSISPYSNVTVISDQQFAIFGDHSPFTIWSTEGSRLLVSQYRISSCIKLRPGILGLEGAEMIWLFDTISGQATRLNVRGRLLGRVDDQGFFIDEEATDVVSNNNNSSAPTTGRQLSLCCSVTGTRLKSFTSIPIEELLSLSFHKREYIAGWCKGEKIKTWNFEGLLLGVFSQRLDRHNPNGKPTLVTRKNGILATYHNPWLKQWCISKLDQQAISPVVPQLAFAHHCLSDLDDNRAFASPMPTTKHETALADSSSGGKMPTVEDDFSVRIFPLSYCGTPKEIKQDQRFDVWSLYRSNLESRAAQKNPHAQYRLGELRFNFRDEIANKEAVKWFEKSAEQGYPAAQRALGYCFYKGKGALKDFPRAFAYFQQAFDARDAEAIWHLGNCYLTGSGVNRDPQKAFIYYQQAAQEGIVFAKYSLGECYRKGIGTAIDSHKAQIAFRDVSMELKVLALKNNPVAQALLGNCFFRGLGISQSLEAAVTWYHSAANQGYDEGLLLLGSCYRYGQGTKKDRIRALDLFLAAANQGLAEAQAVVGAEFGKGEIIGRNDERAIHWLTLATNQGEANAQYCLGIHYQKGWGVNPDQALARFWLQKSADQGQPDAIKELANQSNSS